MESPKYKTALIVGAGEGLSASLARLFTREKIRVALAARKIEKLGELCTQTGAKAFVCDATNADEVERLFGLVEREIATPDIVVYNASGRARGVFVDLVAAGHSCRAFRHRRRHSQCGSRRAGRPAGLDARSRCDCLELLERIAAAAQRVDLGNGIATLGREILRRSGRHSEERSDENNKPG